MSPVKTAFDDLLQTESRQVLRDALARWAQAPTLLQARQLHDHALALTPDALPLRLAIVHTYTSDLLEPWIAFHTALHGLSLQTYHAPYGLAMGEADPASALVAHRPDLTLLMLQRTDLDPEIGLPLAARARDELDALRERCLARLKTIVEAFRRQPVGHIVVTLLPSPHDTALGLHDAQATGSEAAWWQALKSDFGAWLDRESPASTLLDLDEVASTVGRRQFFDARYWYSARYPFTAAAAGEFARRVAAVAAVLRLPRAKVIVLDADNTLWGGVVGEDGVQGIALGPDYPGNAYVAFQRRLLDFQRRGFVLALCSKNNPADLQQVLDEHPHQLLRDAHFAARRVNWQPKPDNLRELAAELNVGLDSFVFVDDSPHECAAVRGSLPEVEVVQTPSRAVDVPGCLDAVARLEILSLTAEDLAKTRMYAQERLRREAVETAPAGDGGDHLQRLAMRMRVGVDPLDHLPRLAQLTKKTNQFNLTTRRHDDAQLRAFMDGDDSVVFDFSLADVFGDSGIVGLAVWRRPVAAQAELDTLLMSCRVIGRRAESAFLATMLRWLAERGVQDIVADYLPTAKNVLVKDFLAQHGFACGADGRWRRDLAVRAAEPVDAYPIDVVVDDVHAPFPTTAENPAT